MCVQTPEEIKQNINKGGQYLLAYKAKPNRQQVLPWLKIPQMRVIKKIKGANS